MKKYFLVFLLFVLFGTIYYYYLDRKANPVVNQDFITNNHFVSLRDGKFIHNEKPFFPLVINYIVSLRVHGNEMWPAPYKGYDNHSEDSNTKDSCLNELRTQFELIHDMGFNTVRLVGIGEPDLENKITGEISFRGLTPGNKDSAVSLITDDQHAKYFEAIAELLDAINHVGLKAIFTVRMFHEYPATEDYLKRLAYTFRNDTALMAYDFFNEPLYFDSIQHTKKEVYNFTSIWEKIVRKYAPAHLCTIGLAGQREISEWDPNLCNVDFISFHPYENEPEQVRNEIYWYSSVIKKPWIIGETGVPADNDSVPYKVQSEFALKTLSQTINCGGIGYSWWQYREVNWGDFRQNHLGVVTVKGITKTDKGNYAAGIPKPMTSAIASFDVTKTNGKCLCLTNYYNFSSHNKFVLKGKLIDEDGNPINYGGILAWDQWFVNHYFTTSKPDGSFELYSDYPFYHWMISSTMHDMIRGDINPDTSKINQSGIPSIDLGNLKLKKTNIYFWQIF